MEERALVRRRHYLAMVHLGHLPQMCGGRSDQEVEITEEINMNGVTVGGRLGNTPQACAVDIS